MNRTPDCPDLIVFDADDTLWESAIFFERAEEDFLLLLKTLGLGVPEARQLVHRRDIERLTLTGYGVRPYIGTLISVLHELCPETPDWAESCMQEIGDSLLSHPVILLPGVPRALEWTASMGIRMIVYTMGEHSHQTDKFRRSGLSRFVEDFVVVGSKTACEMSRLLEDRGVPPQRCLVVGNSPRSDVNPALEVGAWAVLCARERLWQAEVAELTDPARVHHIETLDELPALLGGFYGATRPI